MKTFDEIKEIIIDTEGRDGEEIFFSQDFKTIVAGELGPVIAMKEEFAKSIIDLAWEEGHSAGFTDVFSQLIEFIELSK